ncbi:MAG TPA: cupin domain-containing protein [Acidimicrobiia bacterium]|nr:cupin domain-containing protein [Acidimicrobiia bacterium]
MPVISKETASQTESMEGFKTHYKDVGGYTIAFETYTRDADLAPLFKGLPGDRCQAPHWGVVLKGKLIYRYADGEDVITAGQAYYARPGHLPLLFAGTEVVEFSPTAELAATMGVVMDNLAAAGRWSR